MAFSIQDYLRDNKIKMGKITKEVGNTPFKGGHNDIRKTNYEVKFNENGKLDLYTHKKVTINEGFINEASQVELGEIPVAKAKQVLAFEKILGGKHKELFDGIHGFIVYINVPMGKERIESNQLKKLLSTGIRWIEIDGSDIILGF